MQDSQKPREWVRSTLGDLGEVTTSSVDKKSAAFELPVRLVNYMDVYRNQFIDRNLALMAVTASASEVRRFQVAPGDVLFTPSSETPDDIGHSAVVVDKLPDTLHSYHTVRLRPHSLDKLHVRFLGRLANTSSVLRHFSIRATGSTRYTLTLEDIRSAAVLLPPTTEQRRIAKILDTLDETIRKTEQVIAKLQQMKLGLLHDLLTRGLDENGELRDPDRHPEQFQDSHLGRIPRDWTIQRVGELGTCVTGNTPPSSVPAAWADDGLPFVTPGEIGGDGAMGEYARHLSAQGRTFVRELPARSLLVVCIGSTLGKMAVTHEPVATNQQINAVSVDEAHDVKFVEAALRRQRSQLLAFAGLQAVPIVNRTLFESVEVAVAPYTEQVAIGERLQAADLRLGAEQRLLEKLQALKRGLADDLLTGRRRISEASEGR